MSKTVIWISLFLMMLARIAAILDARSEFYDFEDQLIIQNETDWENRNDDEEQKEHCYKQKGKSDPIMCWSFVMTTSSITFNCTTKGYDASDINIYIGESLQDSTIYDGRNAGDKVAHLKIWKLQVRHINQVFRCRVELKSKNYTMAAMKLQNKNNVAPESPVFFGATNNSEELDVTNGYVLKCSIGGARFDSILEIGSDEKLSTTRSENNGFKPLKVEYTLNSSRQFPKVYCQHKYSTLEKNETKNIKLNWSLDKNGNEENTQNSSTEKPSDKKGNEEDTQKSSTDIARGDSEHRQNLVIVGAAVAAGTALTLVTCLTWMFFRRRRLRRCGERRPLRSNSEEVLRGAGGPRGGGSGDEYASVLPRSQRRPSCGRAREDLYAAVVPKSKRLQNAEGNYSEPYDHVPDQPYLDIGSDIYESMSGSEHYAEPSRGPRYANEPCGDADSGLYSVPSSVSDEYANADALRINERSAPNPIEPPYSTVRPRVAPKPQSRQKNNGAPGYVAMK